MDFYTNVFHTDDKPNTNLTEIEYYHESTCYVYILPPTTRMLLCTQTHPIVKFRQMKGNVDNILPLL